jgi:hypothetical protein
MAPRLPAWFPFGRGPRVRFFRQSRPGNCVQTVVAMALDVPVAAVERETGTDGTLTVAETTVLLNRLGVSGLPMSAGSASDFWDVFLLRHGGRRLMAVAFELPRGGAQDGHAWLLAGRRMYDPGTGQVARLDRQSVRRFDYLLPIPEAARSASPVERLRA